MMQMSAYGRLAADPRQINTKTGTSMAVVTMAVDVDDANNDAPVWLGLVAFGRAADELLRHGKGDLISASGRVQRNSWRDNDGNTRERLEIVADTVISARTVRPSGGRRKQQEVAS